MKEAIHFRMWTPRSFNHTKYIISIITQQPFPRT